MAVLPNEVHVDVGAKYTGIIPADEITGNPSDLSKLFQVGDVVEAQIIKTNDVEGTATLSKKRMDAQKAWVTMSEAAGKRRDPRRQGNQCRKGRRCCEL